MCKYGQELLITRGDVMKIGNTKYLVEPLIRYYSKFTSNNGWIADEDVEGRQWTVEAMEAFSHYSYHKTGGFLIVCDLQGRYRHNRWSKEKCRFELTDPAICSRHRNFGPTDLGEKGIDSFFANHVCNKFCNYDGYWSRPRAPKRWFERSSGTSMLDSTASETLKLVNRVKFNAQLEPIYANKNNNYMDTSDSEDSW